MGYNRIKGLTIEIDGNTTKLTKALAEVNKEVSKTKSALRDVDKLLKVDPGNTELLAQKQKYLSDSIDATKNKLKEEQAALENLKNAPGTEENIRAQDTLQREIIETEQQLKQLTAEYKNFGSVGAQQVKAVGEKMKTIGDKTAQLGGTLTRNVTVPLAAAGTAMVSKFAEVDKVMVLANETMGNTADQANLLNKAMQEAAANSTFGMADAAQAALNFARAGLDATQAAEALGPAMNLAAGEGGNLDTVSSGLVATINGFGDSFENASHYADIFAAACNNSALDVDSLSEAMSVAAPIFKTAGMSVDDAALYMGVMANAGIEASEAANGLKTGFARLIKPAKEGAEAMEKYGISILNADGSIKDSLTIQEELNESFSKMSEAEQIAAASAIFGKNQMSKWLALINTAPSEVAALNDELERSAGVTDSMAEAMMGGFGGSIEKLKSSLDVLMVSLGQLIAEYIGPLINKIQEWVDKLNSLDDAQKNMIIKIAGIAAAVGPVLLVVGKLTSALGSILTFAPQIVSAFTAITGAVGKLGPLFSSLSSGIGGTGAALGALPIVGVIAGIVALIAVIKTAYDTNETFRNSVNTAWAEISASFAGIFQAFNELGQAMVELLNSMGFEFQNFSEVARAAWEAFSTAIAYSQILPVLNNIKSVIVTVGSTIQMVIGGLAALLRGDWSAAWQIFRNNVINAVLGIVNFVAPKVSSLIQLIDFLSQKLAGVKFSDSAKQMLSGGGTSTRKYASAMNGGTILKGATIFGAQNGQYLQAGEAGPEVVVGANSLSSMIRSSMPQTDMVQLSNVISSAVGSALQNYGISIDVTANQDGLFKSIQQSNAQYKKMHGGLGALT